jgi:hypothetical protein
MKQSHQDRTDMLNCNCTGYSIGSSQNPSDSGSVQVEPLLIGVDHDVRE